MNNHIKNLHEVIDHGKASDDPTVRQYAKGLSIMATFAGKMDADLETLDCDMETYLEFAPKYDKRSAPLVAAIARHGWKPNTYKQYQSDGRRMVERTTGALAARQARRAQKDGWSELAERARLLAKAGLIDTNRLSKLARITDVARSMGLEPTDVTGELVIAMRETTSAKDWTSAKRGATLMDDMRKFPTLRSLLPAVPIGRIDVKLRVKNDAPEHLFVEAADWVRTATTVLPTEVVTPEAHAMLTTEHSDGSKGVYAAAIRSYLTVLGQERNLSGVNGLTSLFDQKAIETVIVKWVTDQKHGRPGALSPRTMFRYADVLRLTLMRHGKSEDAAVIAKLCKAFPVLVEGKAANEFMSAETETWCRALLADEESVQIFDTQHCLYVAKANEALEAAQAEGFDLVALSDPARMKRLSDKKRRRAKALLRRTRMFGVCAAAAAVELEGAPFRKANLLGLMRSGRKQTFFDVLNNESPHFLILIPNELLKNGKTLTKKGKSMAPVQIRKLHGSDYGIEILKFFQKFIRPLFPGAGNSDALFPAIDPRHPHLCEKTFDNWLLECSTEIGLPMTPHNYRHGVCSIQINDDPNCIEELATLLCDEPDTIRKYYAFLDRERSLRTMQTRLSNRRAQYGSRDELEVAS